MNPMERKLAPPGDGYAVVIPAYNASATIERALDSALAQTWLPAEVIVIDDGSPDRAAIEKIVSSYDGKVRLVQQPNSGPAIARNTGIAASTSPWIAFLDADDSWLPDKMRRQLGLADDARVGLIHASAGASRSPVPRSLDFETLWERNRICTSTVVVRRTAFEQAGAFDGDRKLMGAEDYNLWLRIAKQGWRVLGCEEVLAAYTPADDSITSRIEQCAAAELYNAAKLGGALALDPDTLRRKEFSIRTDFGRHLLHSRQTGKARRMLARPAFQGLNPEAMTLWLVSCIPVPVLDLLRRVRRARRQDRAIG